MAKWLYLHALCISIRSYCCMRSTDKPCIIGDHAAKPLWNPLFHVTEELIVHSSTTRIYPLRQESIVGGLQNCMEPARGETCILDRDKRQSGVTS
ncbi:hypothetical protein BDV34DRAFT_199590 [Aspergillus parasiticus]|uniref:Secreted protein n=1 Tax=Aspergillus parasiticus TaxID=5067 RepID=A0A5N6DDL3_ASPPA|nr:hypothetical protein BDV34DRAFT_199590 [Aspergillus parasiticus]